MARARSYRDDVRCPHCGANRVAKNGLSRGRQTWRCGECGRRWIGQGAFLHKGEAVQERAAAMYCEGSSLRAIGRISGVSGTAVARWIKKRGPGLGGAESPAPERGGGDLET